MRGVRAIVSYYATLTRYTLIYLTYTNKCITSYKKPFIIMWHNLSNNKIVKNIQTIVYALIIAMLIRGCIFEIFQIPSGSMKDTLMEKDHILVTKYSYGIGPFSMIMQLPLTERLFFTKPKRGDIIVFRSPKDDDPKKFYIKRLIGLPGDKIQILDRIIYINGIAMEHVSAGQFEEHLNRFIEETPEHKKYNVLYDMKINSDEFPNTTKVYEVPIKHYFFMGDNRNNSIDSRFSDYNIGYVHELRLIGKTQYVIWNGSLIDLVIGRASRFIENIN